MTLSEEQQRIYEVLREHPGRENAISSTELAREVGIDESNGNPTTRFAIREIIEETDTPIGSCNEGYFVIAKRHELRDCLADLDSRMSGIRERKRLLHETFEEQGELETPQRGLEDYGGESR